MKRRGARLGQHFLTGTWAAVRLAQSLRVAEGETVLEIGPGKGALTRELLKLGASVVAVEKDEALVEFLAEAFEKERRGGSLRVLLEDVRNFNPEASGLSRYVVGANIPYYVTGEIIRQFLTAETQPRAMALLMQKEVAERILAKDGKESILSLSVKAYGTPKIVAKVSKGNFNPPPSVDSAILLIDGISRAFFEDLDEEFFFKAVRAGFASKRKKLASNLAAIADKSSIQAAFQELGIDENARAETIPTETWKMVAKALS